MSYYLLPHISSTLDIENIDISHNEIINSKKKSNQLVKNSQVYLSNLKKEIEKYPNSWDIYKKYTNTYEYIHSQIPEQKTSVSKCKPLSRSYFKFIELANVFDILSNYTDSLKSFHICEGPGGFIEAISILRNNEKDTYYGMTLVNDEDTTPGWKKSTKFIKNNKNVIIETGQDKTGNILEPCNYMYCANNYANNFEIITGDGGFDFSVDFNNQEIISNKLILSQIIYALTMQKFNGTFILKIFDMFSKSTQDYIYLLSLFYNKVYIFKPQTSRLANSEKYIVCKEFKFKTTTKYFTTFYNIFANDEFQNNKKTITSFFKNYLPYFYTCKLEEVLNVLCQFQINVINNTIQLLRYNKNDNKVKIDEMIKTNVSKCVQWCIKNNIPYNKNLIRN